LYNIGSPRCDADTAETSQLSIPGAVLINVLRKSASAHARAVKLLAASHNSDSASKPNETSSPLPCSHHPQKKQHYKSSDHKNQTESKHAKNLKSHCHQNPSPKKHNLSSEEPLVCQHDQPTKKDKIKQQ